MNATSLTLEQLEDYPYIYFEQEEEAPYKVCTVHTEEKWKEYLESIKPEETEPTVDPNAPTDPNGTTNPTTPNQGGILPDIGEILEGLFG